MNIPAAVCCKSNISCIKSHIRIIMPPSFQPLTVCSMLKPYDQRSHHCSLQRKIFTAFQCDWLSLTGCMVSFKYRTCNNSAQSRASATVENSFLQYLTVRNNHFNSGLCTMVLSLCSRGTACPICGSSKFTF